MNLVEYPDREFLFMKVADTIASELRAALGHEDRVTLALPGGPTPGPVFDTLSGVDLHWDRIDVILTDERWVPESSDRSNARQVRRRLLTGRAEAARFLPLWREGRTPEEALAELTDAVEPLLPPTVCQLGMGPDMHVASMFPDSDRLVEALADDAPVFVPLRRPGEDEVRLTMSMAALKASMSLHLVATGADKRAALERAARLDPMEAPVSAVLNDATIHWAE